MTGLFLRPHMRRPVRPHMRRPVRHLMRHIGLAVLLTLLLPRLAYAEGLQVTLLMAAGSTPLQFSLSDDDTRTFLQRWGRLPRSDRMVPLSADNNYSGLLLRRQDTDSNQDIRLFNNVGIQGEVARSDDLRMLERWVLTKAPPPLGPALVAALDSDVGAQAANEGRAAPAKPANSQQVILDCRTRARRNTQLHILCLEEALKQNADSRDYIRALENSVNQLLPSAKDQQLIR